MENKEGHEELAGEAGGGHISCGKGSKELGQVCFPPIIQYK